MVDVVKPRRAYNSPRRRQQAAATRSAVLDAAHDLFVRDGYAATTMDKVAETAGVSLKTVYLAFATKSGLLRAVWDVRLKGADDDTPVADLPWYVQVLDEQNAERQLRLVAHGSRLVKERIGRLLGAVRDAAPTDPDAGALWELIQTDFYDNQRVIIESIAAKKSLRRGLDVRHATDLLWTFNHPDVWLLLVGRLGWTPDEFERWWAELAITQLIGPSRTAPRR
jgi:AcrR family transcriptional regulator